MASASILPAMSNGSGQSVHPFFTRPTQHTQPKADSREANCIEDVDNDDDAEYREQGADEKPKKKTSKSKSKKNEHQLGKQQTQKTLGEIVNPRASGSSTVVNFTDAPEVDEKRKKRRRTNEHESVDVGLEGQQSLRTDGVSYVHQEEGRASPRVLIPASPPSRLAHSPAETRPSQSETLAPKTPPRKVLRLNAQGKFSSPPAKKSTEEEPILGPPKRRGRSRNPDLITPNKHLLVKVSYGTNDVARSEVGQKIERILSGEDVVVKRQVIATPKKRTPQKPKPSKPSHPFFNRDVGKKQPAASKHVSPKKASAVTPGKLRMQSFSDRIQEAREPSHNIGSALLRDRLMTRHPGAKEPPFPARDHTHIRALDSDPAIPLIADDYLHQKYGQRKRKQARVPVPPEASILARFTSQLAVPGERRLRPDGFLDPDPTLHVPDRLLISGREIAQRVSKELSIEVIDDEVDEISVARHTLVHPSLQRLYDRIPTTMTAFDDVKGENLCWTQKYAPAATLDVLQPGNEMAVLRDWLKSLAVRSVEGSVAVPNKSVSSKVSDKPKGSKKRKSKADEMEDFLVDSDEDVTEMSELPLDGEHESTSSDARKVQRSIVQVVQNGTKLANAVLLSGPSGCGKTAAAYAVAKELGFKVFEIGPSERRSGKDVIDRVGDMTENHLVKHHGTEEPGEQSSTEEPGKNDEAFQKDLESGRQGKMSSFFKSKAKPKQVEPKNTLKEKKLRAVQDAIKKQPRDQQQSLILLEEVDVLFKDDKDFWSTVLRLITTSKRPFIITCNDEDLVPVQAISMHAILRLTPPPVELATDYMLLLAAAEGHLLKREAVASLYQQHGSDLRASISELNFWCQMGIGDPRGGLSWIYQRYPAGSDLDSHGQRLRTVSDGTYEQRSKASAPSKDAEETSLWTWNEFRPQRTTALRVDDLLHKAHESISSTNRQQSFEALKQFSHLTETMSAADAITANGIPGSAALDPTQPELPEKARANYIEGMALMQTDECVDYMNFAKHLYTAMTLLAHRNYDGSEALGSDSRVAHDGGLSRHAFACFDAIAVPKELSATGSGLVQSVFDGPLETITLDLAPYVRAIVYSDQAREQMRDRLNLLTSDGRRAKRARTTRAARSALEGGQRATTRREKWFPNDLHVDSVLATGGKDWPRFSNGMDIASTEGSTSGHAAKLIEPISSAEDETQYR
ncbi:Telomere length regulation elg1 [Lecanosticta acicola]|uniref:Telomere length regulation elg1 n=1 Tax=Lecanosticta acicola TaxID=111012 RepID=A0AAI8YS94_9PEZI|nr:Telomere length regulation elg1 [Lecanosticta acicola]